MPRALRPRLLTVALLLTAAALAAIAGSSAGSSTTARPAAAMAVTVGSKPISQAVPAGFLGISLEYKSLEVYTGTNPAAIDPAFVQLLRNLSPSGAAVLRIGGDSSDWTWWPVPGLTRPEGIKFDLGPNWSAIARNVVQALHGRLILGVNFEADSSKIAAYEEQQLLAHVGASSIDAFELGNEPELYSAFDWFKTATGKKVYGRPPGYDVAQYLTDFSRIAAALPKAPLAGPSSGAPKWLADLGTFVADEPHVGLLTVHAYPTKHCSAHADVTAADLFTTASLQGLASQIASWTQLGASHNLPLRVDEMNSVSCGGERGLTDSFAPALWAVEMLPKLVAAGIAGVNFHTIPTSLQSLLVAAHGSSGWRVAVQPEYLGLLAFSQAAPAGSRLLQVSASNAGGVDVWAAQTSGGAINVVLVNPTTSSQPVTVKVAGVASSATAMVTRLRAASLASTSGVTLDGQTISPSTGRLTGNLAASTVKQSGGAFSVTAPASSATILTLG
jgi:hypothetical protein